MTDTSTSNTNPEVKLIPDLFKPEASKATRDGFGKGLLELGEKNENVWGLSADVSESSRTHWFADKFPKRFVQVGVAEQNMAGVAAGIAGADPDKIVFVSAFGAFSPGRNWDQIRVSVCYNDVNVKFHASHTGLTVGPDGASHQILEDIALMRSLPNMIVIVPADAEETRKATHALAQIHGPGYIRTGREKSAVFTTKDTPFVIGKANIYRSFAPDGNASDNKSSGDVAIFACGFVVYESLKAAEQLAKKGINAAVIDCHTIKPIDKKTILEYAKACGLIVAVEEHQIDGGMGSAIAEVLAENAADFPCRLVRHGIHNRFCESGDAPDLLKKYELDGNGIAKVVEAAVKKHP
ncbi:transketolase family protein [Candidatus Micrarchaeota archaeon]|nr:transketolase family protein [Candidatus Micrarchaeota archaeon]